MDKVAYLQTWGCQMNVHDTEKIAGVLRGEGYAFTNKPEDAALIILNTCSIREKAEHKFLSRLGYFRRLKKKRPAMQIVVSGCIAQQEGEKFLIDNQYVDFTFGPQNIAKLPELILRDKRKAAVEENPYLAETELPSIRNDGTRAWVNIMYGCNNFCSYCVVPHTRGRERSRPMDSIVNEIRTLSDEGYKEITLLGQNVNSYNDPNNGTCASFAELLTAVNAVKGIERVRFVTSHPKDLSPELIAAIGDLDKVCEHIHLPLQSGSTKILSSMNRKYSYAQYLDKITALRDSVPGITITSDIITGFPGETSEDHKETLSALREIEFDGIFAFKYSKRRYTRAADMEGQLDEEIKSERLKTILELQDVITDKINRKLKGQTVEILVEGESSSDPAHWTGRTRTNKIVNFIPVESVKKGMFITVNITNSFRHSLEGQPDR
ncbi:tRNA (N6-isopentenyl adenosine(37)-C2)-methylthiotransferase MiaB [Candidatus Magnetominusculus xianensis]|uniref:tRNA-2-methylthio-N(6)-dimethylallyladenosine synthase n=1 Tax=Candidatus Magnetominusculus xianensis TaxID=1748249 RepID=A0ABR5SBX2_9BACT|nr:tRNA (N6-isopentenyl adenosine(37)-C2)-methylthiotransferase MiaB [Candidatus Magnetominusculus xianensis]KWT75007.1 dimethylallyladenosine tRNA methylthiotransferase MiaB [Candidatus Magnetominusculus xianensis]